MAIHQVLTNTVASITDLKRDPMGTVQTGTAKSGVMAILNRNEPAFYCVSHAMFEYFQELAKKDEMNKINNQ